MRRGVRVGQMRDRPQTVICHRPKQKRSSAEDHKTAGDNINSVNAGDSLARKLSERTQKKKDSAKSQLRRNRSGGGRLVPPAAHSMRATGETAIPHPIVMAARAQCEKNVLTKGLITQI